MTMIGPRERLTEGVTKERLRMEAKRSAFPTLVFLAGLGIAFVLLVYLITNISETFGHKTRTIRFAAPTAFGVFEGFDDVRYRGVPAGTITKIERDGPKIVFVAEIRSSFGPIFKNARAELRPVTPLNDEYLDIVDQGTEARGEADPDVPLPAAQTKVSVTGPEVFDMFKADERRNFHHLLDELGNGLEDRGAKLRAAFAEAVPFLQGAGELTRQIAARKLATKRLVHNTSILTEELGRRETQLRRLVSQGSVTLGALQQSTPDLDATLRTMGPMLAELHDGVSTLDTVLADANAGIDALGPVAKELPGGLKGVRDLNDELKPLLRSLDGRLVEMTPAVVALTKVFGNIRDTGTALQAQVPVFDKTTRNLVTCEKGVIGFMQWDTSLMKYGDKSGGPIPRGNLAFGVPDVGLSSERRKPHNGCTPGPVVGGRPITDEDEH